MLAAQFRIAIATDQNWFLRTWATALPFRYAGYVGSNHFEIWERRLIGSATMGSRAHGTLISLQSGRTGVNLRITCYPASIGCGFAIIWLLCALVPGFGAQGSLLVALVVGPIICLHSWFAGQFTARRLLRSIVDTLELHEV